jgi:heme/copper-type cytochrome/quinol oxidase subunit 4
MYSIEQILHIAKMQKGMLRGILLIFAAIPLSIVGGTVTGATLGPQSSVITVLTIISGGLMLAGGIMQLIYFFRLAFALEAGAITIILYLIGLIVPLVSLIVLFWLNGKANKLMKAEGFTVGLVGANIAEIEAQVFNTNKYAEDFQ